MKSLVALAILVIGVSGSWTANSQTSGSSGSISEFAAQQPVHLLVLFPAGLARPSDAVLLNCLKKLPRNGWLVNIERKDGSLTGFVSRDALPGALAQTAPGQDSHAQLDAAVDELLRDPRNSLLLFASKVQTEFKTPSYAEDLVRKRIPVYVVDGGRWGRIERGDNGREPGTMPDDYLTTRKIRKITGGILHEVSLTGAVKDLIKDRKNGYPFLYSQPN